MKIDDYEQSLASFLRFLEGVHTNIQKPFLHVHDQPKFDWRHLEEWAHAHSDPEIRALCRSAFDLHDQDSMNQLRLEYAWFLRRNE